jgi:hypothetical protein
MPEVYLQFEPVGMLDKCFHDGIRRDTLALVKLLKELRKYAYSLSGGH